MKEATRKVVDGVAMVVVGRTGKTKTGEGYLFSDEPKTVAVGRNNFGDEKAGEARLAIQILLEEGKLEKAEAAIEVYELVARNAAEVAKGGRAMLAAARKVAEAK